MRRTVAIIGILLIAAVLIISGSAVAPWAVDWVEAYTSNVTDPDNALDDAGLYGDATIGQNSPPLLGVLMLDLGSGNEMGANQLFTVYGWSGLGVNIYETYNVTIYTDGLNDSYGPYNGWDSADLDFYTPLTPQAAEWRYIEITGTYGEVQGGNQYDTIYGPEIDAVGY